MHGFVFLAQGLDLPQQVGHGLVRPLVELGRGDPFAFVDLGVFLSG